MIVGGGKGFGDGWMSFILKGHFHLWSGSIFPIQSSLSWEASAVRVHMVHGIGIATDRPE
jgi:hypothetical protein